MMKIEYFSHSFLSCSRRTSSSTSSNNSDTCRIPRLDMERWRLNAFCHAKPHFCWRRYPSDMAMARQSQPDQHVNEPRRRGILDPNHGDADDHRVERKGERQIG